MKSNNTSLIILVTALVSGLAYWYFFTGTGNEAPLSVIDAPTNQTQMQFETLVGELQSVTFNTAIFADARFNALVDIGTQVSPESIGRLDPLAPLSGSSYVPPAPVIVNPVSTPVPASTIPATTPPPTTATSSPPA